MILNILAVAESGLKIGITIVGLLVYAFVFAVIIIGLIRLVRYLGSAKNEQKLIRMELSKLAEEVHLIRQELKGGEVQDSSAESE